uniref:Reverse transcriptase Ty1/copia-type domain-containing protein n=1 Tax=Chenopodium quinoa TaxID=63459 RepID=A0A803N1Q0_CHEQI
MQTEHSFTLVVAYVDDLLVTSSDSTVITILKTALNSAFTITDLGALKYFLGIEVSRSDFVQQLSQFLSEPRAPHWSAAVHVLRYLKGTINFGLFYPANSGLSLEAFSDADWGTCIDSTRSLTGYCVFMGNSLISWKTQK